MTTKYRVNNGRKSYITMLRDHCSAEPFLRQASDEIAEFRPELSLAAGCYSEMKGIRNKMDGLIDDSFSKKSMEAISDPDIRRSFASTILQIRDKEEEAVSHIERLLERC